MVFSARETLSERSGDGGDTFLADLPEFIPHVASRIDALKDERAARGERNGQGTECPVQVHISYQIEVDIHDRTPTCTLHAWNL